MYDLSCSSLYDKLFVKAWSMKTTAMIITGLFVLLMGTTGAGLGQVLLMDNGLEVF